MIKDHYAVIIQKCWRSHRDFESYRAFLRRMQQCTFHIVHCNLLEFITVQGCYRCDMCFNKIWNRVRAENVMSIYATHVTKGAMPTISVKFKSC